MKNVIYIHPKTPMTYPRNIPISLPALIKRIPAEVKGYCATQITDNQIRQADIVIVDIHWFFSLKGAGELVKRIRRIKKEIVIISGGITSTEFPGKLINDLDIDFVIRGDGEIPLPMLVELLVTGVGDMGSIPNLVGKNGVDNTFRKPYKLDKEDFNQNHFYDIDFFPFMKNELQLIHKINPGMPPYVYPFLLPFRGCPIACDFCSGAYGEQQKLFNRKVVYRSPEVLAGDIEFLGSQSWIKFCNCLLDFVALLPHQYSEVVLKKKSRLNIQYEFTKAPMADELEFLLSGFSGGTIHFSVDNMHLTSENHYNPAVLAPLIKKVQRTKSYVAILDFSSVYTLTNKDYARAVADVYKTTKCLLYDGSIWWSDFPKPGMNGYGDPDKFEYFKENAVSTNHLIANTLNKTINELDKILPPPVLRYLRKSYYRYYHGYSFLLKNNIASRFKLAPYQEQ